MRSLMPISLLALGMAGAVQAMPPGEDAKAKALLAKVEGEKGAVFIRNDKEYTSANAAEFLRRKCAKEWDQLASAREFVRQCASTSSTSGKPYQIKLAGSAPRASGEVLGEWLEAIEAGKK
jgi:hypothetical protein